MQSIEVPAVGDETGRAVVLHSNGMCADFYRPLMEALAQRQVGSVAFDLPGFAGPPPPDKSWDGFLAAVRPDVARALGPDGVLVGHSLGGLVALLLAPSLPLRALVLMEPAIIPWRWLARLAAAVYVRRVFDGRRGFTNRGPWFWRLHDPTGFAPDRIAQVQATHARADRALVDALHVGLATRYPLPFDAVTVPVVAVRGASSGRVMALGQRDLVRRLPNARAVTVPEAGHWLANEQDELLAQCIAEALR